MGRAPDVIFIVRHGARLDAADKNWAASSSTPWDTPLSHGGWQQTRALGARIASLLRTRDVSADEEDGITKRRSSDTSYMAIERPGSSQSNRSSQSGRSMNSHKRKKHRVILHTSPFLRCIQSSIAISAGMAQYQGNLSKFEAAGSAQNLKMSRPGPNPHSRSQTLDSRAFLERYGPHIGSEHPEKARNYESPPVAKNKLRIDAFLGEWLSRDYFEFAAAPPSSNMIVAGAKADLLRSADPIQGARLVPFEDNPSDLPLALPQTEEGQASAEPLRSMNDMIKSLPGYGAPPRSMASVYGDISNVSHHPAANTATKTSSSVRGYNPPQPLYALAPVQPIPRGFVAHARDACVDVDLAWDSMHEPQSWGDGGTYGEEWSALHNRFRKGIRDLVYWYKTRGPEYDPQQFDESTESDDVADDEDTELVVVIVTHGAGCNALIGALTNQPVLMDVGMASLTMAVSKHSSLQHEPASDHLSPERRRQASSPPAPGRRRRSSVDMSLSHEYDMKLVANSEHLRAGADPLAIPQLQLSSAPDRDRQRRFSNVSLGMSSPLASGSMSPFEVERPPARNSALGSIRRKGTAGSSRSFMSDAGIKPTGSISSQGLWGSRAQSAIDTDEIEESLSPTTFQGERAPSADNHVRMPVADEDTSPADGSRTPTTESPFRTAPANSGELDVPRPEPASRAASASRPQGSSASVQVDGGMYGSNKAPSRAGSGLWAASPRGVSALKKSDA